jgi:hypothetical protein
VSFNLEVSLLLSCLDRLSVGESGVLKSSTIIALGLFVLLSLEVFL